MENGSQAKHWKRNLCPSPTAPPTVQEKDFKAGEELTVFVIWVGEGQAERLQSRAEQSSQGHDLDPRWLVQSPALPWWPVGSQASCAAVPYCSV